MIPYSKQTIDEDDIKAVSQALQEDILTCGQTVDKFEEELAKYVGVKHAVALNSATSALHALYLAIGLQKGDEIITTPITFAATSNAALMCGADVKFADVKFDGNIDPKQVKNLITPNTKAIVGVDFGGKPINIQALRQIANENKIALIDDASHALGSIYGGENAGKKVGSMADASVFSFHPIKPITTLEGGAVVTDNDKIAQKVKLIRSHGISKKQLWDSDMHLLGYNYRLSDVACALGLNQLKKLDSFIKRRNEIAAYYDERFKNNKYFSIIKIGDDKNYGERSSRHLYPILLHPNLYCYKQDFFQDLQKANIGVQVHYKPTYKFSFYQQKYGQINLKNAEEFYKAELSMPCHQNMSDNEAKYVADTLLSILDDFNGCRL